MHPTTAARPSPAPARKGRRRPHWVVAELDAHGEIDDHAAMCLLCAIEDACAVAAAGILVDLRDLTAIDPDGLALLVRQDAACRARGVQLGLLICGDRRDAAIARRFAAAGLGDQLQFTRQQHASPPRMRRAPCSAEQAAHGERVRTGHSRSDRA